MNETEYNRGALRPIRCLGEGWRLIKSNYWLFLGIDLVGVLIGGAAPFGVLMGPMMCGIYRCHLRHMQGRPISFNDLFQGFNYFGPSLVATLFMIVPIIILLPLFYIGFFIGMFAIIPNQQQQNAPPDASFFFALFGLMAALFGAIMLVSMAVQALFMFAYPLIVDRDLPGTTAVGTSIRAAFGNLIGVIVLIVLTMLLGMAGLLALYVGAILVMPISLAANAVAYRQVFPLQVPPAVIPVEPEPYDAPPADEPQVTDIRGEAKRDQAAPTDFVPGPPPE
jgi:hypothetical protein